MNGAIKRNDQRRENLSLPYAKKGTNFLQSGLLAGRPIQQSSLLDLSKLQLYWSRTTKNKDRHAQPALFVIDLFDNPVEVVERPINDSHHFTGFEYGLGLRLLDGVVNPLQNSFRSEEHTSELQSRGQIVC